MRRSYLGATGFPYEPYAYYQLNGDVLDYSGNNRHALAPNATPSWFTAGFNGRQALQGGSYLAGNSGDTFGVRTPWMFDSSWQSFIVVFKVYVTSQANYNNLFDIHHASVRGCNMQYNTADSGWAITVTNQSPPFPAPVGLGFSLPLNQWITVTFIRRRSDGLTGVFVDTNLRQQQYVLQDMVFQGSPTYNNSTALLIGGCAYWGRYLNGRVQDFAIFKGEYTDAQIQDIISFYS